MYNCTYLLLGVTTWGAKAEAREPACDAGPPLPLACRRCPQAETTLINFTVTEAGLEDQLLALVVNKERPDLEETKTQLIIQVRPRMCARVCACTRAQGGCT